MAKIADKANINIHIQDDRHNRMTKHIYPSLNNITLQRGTKIRYIGMTSDYGKIYTIDSFMCDIEVLNNEKNVRFRPTVKLEEASGFYFIHEGEWEPLEIYDEETQFYAILNGILL